MGFASSFPPTIFAQMKNAEKWVPTKYVRRGGRLTASSEGESVAIGSRLVVSLVAKLYERYLGDYARGRLIDLGCGKVPLRAVLWLSERGMGRRLSERSSGVFPLGYFVVAQK